jgi:hypothetical protein
MLEVADCQQAGDSGGRSYCHVEGESFSGGVVIGGIALEGERNCGQTVLLGGVT